jgi:hypothetical protein
VYHITSLHTGVYQARPSHNITPTFKKRNGVLFSFPFLSLLSISIHLYIYIHKFIHCLRTHNSTCLHLWFTKSVPYYILVQHFPKMLITWFECICVNTMSQRQDSNTSSRDSSPESSASSRATATWVPLTSYRHQRTDEFIRWSSWCLEREGHCSSRVVREIRSPGRDLELRRG